MSVGWKRTEKVIVTAGYLFPRWEHFIPRLGMFCSQGGNNSSAIGAVFSFNKERVLNDRGRLLKIKGRLLRNKGWLLENKGTLLRNKWQLFEKCLISPVNVSECLNLKGTCIFHHSRYPSLDLSHHLSLDPSLYLALSHTLLFKRKNLMLTLEI